MKSFVITSDCDHLLAKEHISILKTFAENGIFVTTAVFARVDDENSWLGRHCNPSETHGWENAELRKGLLEAQSMGHEIAFHGTSQCSNTREIFIQGIEDFKQVFGEYPFTYIEHGPNPLTQKGFQEGDCKLEMLSNKGADIDSPYFVKDIIEEVFSACWTQEFLLSADEIPKEKTGWIVSKDNINYINRMRMLDFVRFQKLSKKLNNENESFIGYTHFGYEGYFGPKRRVMLDMFRPFLPPRFEYWRGKHLEKNISEIRSFLKHHDFQSKTVKEFVLSCQK
tara:strand:+ start:34 stop:879 length:846 start_codon:yes stop_codon:yes gene_type:complete